MPAGPLVAADDGLNSSAIVNARRFGLDTLIVGRLSTSWATSHVSHRAQ